MKRPLSLSAYILGTITAVCALFANLANCILLGNVIGDSFSIIPAGVKALFILMCIYLAVLFIMILFNSVAITYSILSHRGYEKKYQFFVGNNCVNILGMAFCLVITILVKAYLGSATTSYSITFLALCVSVVLSIVDMSNEKLRVKLASKSSDNSDFNLTDGEDEDENNEKLSANGDKIEAELKKLNELKIQGLINEEDLNKLKHNLIQKYLK